MTKRIFSILLIGAALLVFGFSSYLMIHDGIRNHDFCIPGISEGNMCEAGNPLGNFTAHSNIIKNLATMLPVASLLLFTFFIFAFISSECFFLKAETAVFAGKFVYLGNAYRKLNEWISLHERRDDSAINFAMNI